MAASNLVTYAAFFAAYSATVIHTILYHRKEIADGFKNAYRSIRAGQRGNAAFKDYHSMFYLCSRPSHVADKYVPPPRPTRPGHARLPGGP